MIFRATLPFFLVQFFTTPYSVQAQIPPVSESPINSNLGSQMPQLPSAMPTITPSTEAFIYDPNGKRDPFEPPEGQAKTSAKKDPEPNGEAEVRTLESFELKQLRVAAIIWDTKVPRALIVDPDGNSHYVKVNTRLGRNNGVVVTIREREVVVLETADDFGQVAKSYKILEL